MLNSYAYDAFGRRIETIEYLGDSTRNLYDGFSFDIAEKKVLNRTASFDVSVKTRSGSAAAQTQTRGTNGAANGTRYRYIDDTPLVPLEQAGSGSTANAGSSAAAAKTRSRPNAEYVLYARGEAVAVNAEGTASNLLHQPLSVWFSRWKYFL